MSYHLNPRLGCLKKAGLSEMGVITKPFVSSQATNKHKLDKNLRSPETIRDMPPYSSLPKDEVGREIAMLLWERPELASESRQIDLLSASHSKKVEFLDYLRERVGIARFRRPTIGYLGR